MDKLLIVVGIALLYSAIEDRQSELIDEAYLVVTQPGFLGYMAIYAGMLTIVTTYKPAANYVTPFALLITLALWNKYAPRAQ